MRIDPRAQIVDFIPAALLAIAFSITILSGSGVRAEVMLQPQIDSAAKTNMSWNDLTKPKPATLQQLRSKLEPADELATLYALQVALTRVGDGQTYIWGRPKRQLRALITPVNSFRHADGRVCREIVMSISLGNFMKRTKTVACRAADRSWHMDS